MLLYTATCRITIRDRFTGVRLVLVLTVAVTDSRDEDDTWVIIARIELNDVVVAQLHIVGCRQLTAATVHSPIIYCLCIYSGCVVFSNRVSRCHVCRN